MSALEGRTAVVTGASSGHGRAIALALAAEGAAVVCADVRKQAATGGYEDDLEVDTDDAIAAIGGRAVFAQTDVSDVGQVDAAAQRAIDEFERLDVFVNNAGVSLGFFPITDEPEDVWDRHMAVNAKGVWLGCRAAVRHMREQERSGRSRGRIVNIGSVAGAMGQADLGSYSASKAAVHHLTTCLAVECAPLAINVNAISPGYFATAMNRELFEQPEALARVERIHPWPELGTPADIASAAVFLASDAAAWITGAILPVDGGLVST